MVFILEFLFNGQVIETLEGEMQTNLLKLIWNLLNLFNLYNLPAEFSKSLL